MKTFQTNLERFVREEVGEKNEITPRGGPWFSCRSRGNDQDAIVGKCPHRINVRNIY